MFSPTEVIDDSFTAKSNRNSKPLYCSPSHQYSMRILTLSIWNFLPLVFMVPHSSGILPISLPTSSLVPQSIIPLPIMQLWVVPRVLISGLSLLKHHHQRPHPFLQFKFASTPNKSQLQLYTWFLSWLQMHILMVSASPLLHPRDTSRLPIRTDVIISPSSRSSPPEEQWWNQC